MKNFNDAMKNLHDDGGYIYEIDGQFYVETEPAIVVEICGMDAMRDRFDDDTIATAITMVAMKRGGMSDDEINKELSEFSADAAMVYAAYLDL